MPISIKPIFYRYVEKLIEELEFIKDEKIFEKNNK